MGSRLLIQPALEDAGGGTGVAFAALALAFGGCGAGAAALFAACERAELLLDWRVIERGVALALCAAIGAQLGGELFAEAAEAGGLFVLRTVSAGGDADDDGRHILAVKQAADRGGRVVLRFGEVDRAEREGESIVARGAGDAEPALAGIDAEDAAALHDF